nr:MAG TPA: hypothetical protein [Caudoviricetes sp.]
MEKANLEMIKGDTLSFAVEIEFDDKPQELEKAFFTCKRNLDDGDVVFQKTLEDGISFRKQERNKMYYVVRIAPEDTNDIETGHYFYDMQIELNSDVFTILTGALKVRYGITD